MSNYIDRLEITESLKNTNIKYDTYTSCLIILEGLLDIIRNKDKKIKLIGLMYSKCNLVELRKKVDISYNKIEDFQSTLLHFLRRLTYEYDYPSKINTKVDWKAEFYDMVRILRDLSNEEYGIYFDEPLKFIEIY